MAGKKASWLYKRMKKCGLIKTEQLKQKLPYILALVIILYNGTVFTTLHFLHSLGMGTIS
jgi:hypothetical protein